MGWFERARFGMFVHWGHVSQRGWELSWPLVGGVSVLPKSQDVPAATYHESAATFAPERNSPRAWLAHAKRLGMHYAVLTTKHHDGFALFDSRVSDFTLARAPYRGDVVREFVDATREAGLRVGLYYSLSDWHHRDYPAFRDEHRPYSFGARPRTTEVGWARYTDFLFAQIRELLTNYGPIDLLWFDGGWERTPYEWRADELRALIRELQPECLVNDRLPGHGDFDTPEQFVPPEPPARAWETCLTMNESWGWNPSDTSYKTARDLVHVLCEVASRGGNLLLNVGPMGDGRLPAEQLERFDAIARWMSDYGDAILDTEPGLAPWQFYGPTTRRGDRLFLHLLMRPYETVTVRGVPIRRIQAVQELRTERALDFTTRCAVIDTFNADAFGELVVRVPDDVVDPLATVLAVDVGHPA